MLGTPPTVTTTFPVVAPLGTGTPMLVALQLVGVAAVPLNRTVLVPGVAPKFAPVMVTGVPGLPDVGESVEILGGGGGGDGEPPVTVTFVSVALLMSAVLWLVTARPT